MLDTMNPAEEEKQSAMGSGPTGITVRLSASPGDQIYGLLINVCGEIVEKTRLEAANGDFESAITAWMDEQIKKREIKSIGIGVPGAVEGKGYWRTNEADGKLYKIDIGDSLEKRYKIPVVLENDLKARHRSTVLRQRVSCENPENTILVSLL